MAAPSLIIVCPDLKEIVQQVVSDGFALFQEKVTVGINEPENPALLPFVGINLLSDPETASHIGDSLADETVDEEGRVYGGIATQFQQSVEVKLWTTNAAQRDRMGKLLKIILFWGRGNSANPGLFTTTDGMDVPKISGGADEGISITAENSPPHGIFTRTYVLSALTDLRIQEPVGEPIEQIVIAGTRVSDLALLPEIITIR